MMRYHDDEWGIPQHDSRMLWETLMLEGFQAGLSWEIVLKKRENFRSAFKHFKPELVATFDENDVSKLMQNTGIIRSRAKILATIEGARIYIDMASSGQDFADYCWSFTNGEVLRGNFTITESSLSNTISKALKKKGFKFVGPKIVYAWMQAVGITNDHSSTCFAFKKQTSPPKL